MQQRPVIVANYKPMRAHARQRRTGTSTLFFDAILRVVSVYKEGPGQNDQVKLRKLRRDYYSQCRYYYCPEPDLKVIYQSEVVNTTTSHLIFALFHRPYLPGTTQDNWPREQGKGPLRSPPYPRLVRSTRSRGCTDVRSSRYWEQHH